MNSTKELIKNLKSEKLIAFGKSFITSLQQFKDFIKVIM